MAALDRECTMFDISVFRLFSAHESELMTENTLSGTWKTGITASGVTDNYGILINILSVDLIVPGRDAMRRYFAPMLYWSGGLAHWKI